MQTAKLLLIAGITFLLAGCKLAVIAVEGGEVQSIGTGTCVAGNVCLIDVPDTNFSETFTAVPDEGWYFHKWNQGGRFFCGNSFNPVCTLSFEGLQGGENIEALVSSSEVFYLMPVFKDYPRATLVDGRPRVIQVDGKKWEWLQPTDFIGYTYQQVRQICPKATCSGALPGSEIDLTGYFWASDNDVRFLIQAYSEKDRPFFDDFEPTGHAVDRGIDGPLLEVILSDPPHREGPCCGAPPEEWISDGHIIGSDEDPTYVFYALTSKVLETGLGVEEYGHFFWRPLD